MESALKYKDRDIKYMLVHVPESCLKLGSTRGCQPRFFFLRRYVYVKAYLTFYSKYLDPE